MLRMLSEPECRVLSRAFDLMLADFDPKDAVNYLLCSGVLSENLAEKIEAKATRLERMRELLRIYRRRATGCEPLISYFEYAAQEHIANSLRTDLEHIMDGPSPSASQQTFSHSIRLRKLLAGNVPRVWKHVKREKLQNEVVEVLRKRADLGQFAWHPLKLSSLPLRRCTKSTVRSFNSFEFNSRPMSVFCE
ncbi:unnamed protein product [Nippostrongylus brasiliensis]|uniref:Cell death protein 4 (inferred by orthology to a C. elegans protein) n=1 Tax=Nippostrongylus brasiliensis TaxID=27835 RepID=A0A0N4XMY1_NIPBR|nr:unnamed protein product [Nippostrongylus brasiliensis]